MPDTPGQRASAAYERADAETYRFLVAPGVWAVVRFAGTAVTPRDLRMLQRYLALAASALDEEETAAGSRQQARGGTGGVPSDPSPLTPSLPHSRTPLPRRRRMTDPTPGEHACAYCEEAPAVLCHLWLSDAWDREPLCLVCQGYVLAEPHLPRLMADPEDEEDTL